MIIEIEKIKTLVDDAGKIFISPDGENILVELLHIQQQVEDAIAMAKLELEKKALALDPNFTSIQGDRVKVYYRAYGSKYSLDESRIAELPETLYKSTVKYTAEADAIDKLLEETGKLPLGIIKNNRPRQLTFTKKNEK